LIQGKSFAPKEEKCPTGVGRGMGIEGGKIEDKPSIEVFKVLLRPGSQGGPYFEKTVAG
jgi:hypothetical protein